MGSPQADQAPGNKNTLAIDIGGSGLKASVLDEAGNMVVPRRRVPTPQPAVPEAVVPLLIGLAKGTAPGLEDTSPLPDFSRISVGFPGVVRGGKVLTAPNLSTEAWSGFELAKALSDALGAPVRMLNDADMQGLAAVNGNGVEMVITLGTGFGTALYENGRLGPHLEIAHIPFRKGETYDQHLGNAARKAVGNKKWNKRVEKAIANLRTLTLFDHLYIGGGNAKKLTLELPDDISVIDNSAGILGGIALWRD